MSSNSPTPFSLLRCFLAVALFSLTLQGCVTTTFPNFSHWDTSIPSIANFPAEQAPAVVHRCSRGMEVDNLYRQRAAEARRRPDILWGAYHFCDGIPVDQQLDLAFSRVGFDPNGRFRTLMAFDFEKNSSGTKTNLTLAQLAELIRKYQARTGGRLPVIYVNPGWINGVARREAISRADKAVIKSCPLWTSAYRAKPKKATLFGNWKIWQYSGDDSLPGYGGNSATYPRGIPGVGRKLEMNIFKGDVDQLREFWMEHSIPTVF